jgi:hypothetical protein
MRSPEKFVLIWKQAGTVISTIDVPRKDNLVREGQVELYRYPDLAEKIDSEWKSVGQHKAESDKKFDQAILHTDNETPYKNIIGVIDAIYKPQRKYTVGGKTVDMPAFNVTFAVN